VSKKFEIRGEDMSDGYHTFDELYEHRNLLFINLRIYDPAFSGWKKDESSPGWFILYWESPAGQISYHIQNKYLCIVEKHVKEAPDKEWDGHKSEDVIFRLRDNAMRGKL
jgi:hypothetical protein